LEKEEEKEEEEKEGGGGGGKQRSFVSNQRQTETKTDLLRHRPFGEE
jgi:hypothetical protein